MVACRGTSGQILVYHEGCDGVDASDGWFEACLDTDGQLQIIIPDNCCGFWRPIGGGLNTRVEALTVWNGYIVAGGDFTSSDGTVLNHVAYWDGSQWNPLGAGMNDTVRALTVWNGTLIAGGDFTTADNNPAIRTAYWTGSTWHQVGDRPLNASVYALTVWNDILVVGGQFRHFMSSDGYDIRYAAYFDGDRWQPFASQVNNTVLALTAWNGNLVAGGKFSQAGNKPYANCIAYWNGVEWNLFGSGRPSWVYALLVWNTEVIAGGKGYTSPGPSVAAWNGASWIPVQASSGFSDDVYALEEWDGNLVAGGNFRQADGQYVEYICYWDGVAWQKFENGLSGNVTALKTFSGDLVAGGMFNHAYGYEEDLNHVGRWTG